MSEPDSAEDLERRMAAAVEAEDFETAAHLRDRLKALPVGNSYLRRQVPGAMGLGTDTPAHNPPQGWIPPARPDPMTANHKPGARRRK